MSKQSQNANKSQDIENLLLNPQKVPELALEKDMQHSKSFSIQPKKLIYQPTESLDSNRFEQDLTTILRSRVEKIRLEEPKVALNENRHLPLITKWNSHITELINKGLLVILESFSYKVRQFSVEGDDVETFKNQSLVDLRNFKVQLAGEIGSNKIIYGIPLRFTHLNIDKIWEEIKFTEFYDKFSEDLEFVMTSSVFGYPNALFSVWVFVGFIYTDN
jgi:hypothetical protein